MLPKIIRKTERTLNALKQLQKEQEAVETVEGESTQEQYQAVILQEWVGEMVELGVYPKGYFTVDFKSPIPDTLFCWTYGEKEISHTHKTFEAFKDRRPIRNKGAVGFEQSLN